MAGPMNRQTNKAENHLTDGECFVLSALKLTNSKPLALADCIPLLNPGQSQNVCGVDIFLDDKTISDSHLREVFKCVPIKSPLPNVFGDWWRSMALATGHSSARASQVGQGNPAA